MPDPIEYCHGCGNPVDSCNCADYEEDGETVDDVAETNVCPTCGNSTCTCND